MTKSYVYLVFGACLFSPFINKDFVNPKLDTDAFASSESFQGSMPSE